MKLHRLNKIVPIAFCVFLVFFASCKKNNEEDPTMSTTPEITFKSISPSSVKEYQDQITITISYTDGDGDLGENNPDAKNLFIIDTRNSVTYEFRISQLAPSTDSIAIQGDLPIILNNTAITDGSSSQSVSYGVYVQDLAGNNSNMVFTGTVTITQ
ncbi:hypothetical protein JYU20_01190 [Bacteroidales bacterium AH-315-I05]|nr:hypothetical protein [Bacteroidales bacterium AH-315-I05]